MYVNGNPKTKKALREALQRGEQLTVFAPGLGTPKENGVENVEGPHYPAPHTWYARVQMKDGVIQRVVS
jgi:hypothetical protein